MLIVYHICNSLLYIYLEQSIVVSLCLLALILVMDIVMINHVIRCSVCVCVCVCVCILYIVYGQLTTLEL